MTPGHILVPLLAVVAVLPFVPPAAALVTGVAVALAFGNPWLSGTRKLAPLLLGVAVMGLGAAADLGVVGRVGLRGIGYTAVGISLTFLAGLLLARVRAGAIPERATKIANLGRIRFQRRRFFWQTRPSENS